MLLSKRTEDQAPWEACLTGTAQGHPCGENLMLIESHRKPHLTCPLGRIQSLLIKPEVEAQGKRPPERGRSSRGWWRSGPASEEAGQRRDLLPAPQSTDQWWQIYSSLSSYWLQTWPLESLLYTSYQRQDAGSYKRKSATENTFHYLSAIEQPTCAKHLVEPKIDKSPPYIRLILLFKPPWQIPLSSI